jgi:hypothetical protein
MIAYDSAKEEQDVRWNWERGAYWVDCDICLYDGENETEVTKEFALSKLKEHNHYPLVDIWVRAIEKELG